MGGKNVCRKWIFTVRGFFLTDGLVPALFPSGTAKVGKFTGRALRHEQMAGRLRTSSGEIEKGSE